MRIVNLIENTEGRSECLYEHGLSFYIETERHKALLDLGQTDNSLRNAESLGVDLKVVDTVVLSHGHYDHSGGIIPFTRINDHAAIYMQSSAGGDYYADDGKMAGDDRYRYIGIAVTYDNGNVFGHFGRTEQFKVYDIEDGKVVNSQILGTDGEGCGALAGILNIANVDALICGGIGGGAQRALQEAGIKLYAGASGNTDVVVDALIAGTLDASGEANCDHHDHEHSEGHSCGHGGCHH